MSTICNCSRAPCVCDIRDLNEELASLRTQLSARTAEVERLREALENVLECLPGCDEPLCFSPATREVGYYGNEDGHFCTKHAKGKGAALGWELAAKKARAALAPKEKTDG